jgi:hypothetical protein
MDEMENELKDLYNEQSENKAQQIKIAKEKNLHIENYENKVKKEKK